MITARELASRIRDGKLSAVEALDEHLERIGKYNPALNAIVSLDVESARRQAERADAALREGKATGGLHGVPMTVKDGFDVAGMRSTVGSPDFDHVPDQDATVVTRLRAAGAVIVGHTNVPPWLADYRSDNPIFGRTANPWDLDRTPGGSSGGAAAALAAGLVPLEVGTDLAGSIRLPAHFCGVYGLKTTEHRVPSTGFFRWASGVPRPVRIMGTTGPMARDLDDLGLALSIISGPDGQDGDVAPVPLGPRRRRALSDLRLAVVPALPGALVDQALRGAVERVASAASDAGARVDDRLPDIDWPAMNELFVELLHAVTGAFDPGADLPAEHRTMAWYLRALHRRDQFAAAWQSYFADVDALVLPPALSTAFTHDAEGYQGLGQMLVFANLAGLPALVTPGGVHDGLPVGVQIVGPRWSEHTLLDIAAELEGTGVLPGLRHPPGY